MTPEEAAATGVAGPPADAAGASGSAILVPEATAVRAADFLQALRDGRAHAGARLSGRLQGVDLATLTVEGLLGKLFDTKVPQIFAESAVIGDGSDWGATELGLLGDVSMAVPVTVFDDGRHTDPTPHERPFAATLVFTPGALLHHGRGGTPADWAEVTDADGRVSEEGYDGLYRRRLLPVFRYIDHVAGRPRSAFVTVPGLGCGQFAGPFRGRLGVRLQAVLERFLAEFGASLPNLKAVYFDPYDEGANARDEIHGIAWIVRPSRAPGNEAKAQLCPPEAYEEPGDDFADCALFSLVAWDHVSWPGNDFFLGERTTDDGVKAAATSSMTAVTGVEGVYDAAGRAYRPPIGYRNWAEVADEGVRTGRIRLWDPQAVWWSGAPPARGPRR